MGWLTFPQYRIYYDGTLTNWDNRMENYSSLHKNIRHWSGEFEIGNWSPTFVDENNEIWGSLYGGTGEARGKTLSIDNNLLQLFPAYGNAIYGAAIYDGGIWNSQFNGIIRGIKSSNGRLVFDVKDSMKDLPTRQFVFDYQNLGSVGVAGTWGIVKYVLGTNIMFDDLGSVSYYQRTRPGVSLGESFLKGLESGIIGLITSGNPWVALGATALGVINNPPTSDQVIGGYYQIQDSNIIPDDVIRSGERIRFSSGSFNGIATNLNGLLATSQEYTVLGGTLVNGIYATVAFQTTFGINVGDYLYIRQPILYSGNPGEIIKTILTGSNIDYKYTGTDFYSEWDSDVQGVELMNLFGIIDVGDNSLPIDKIKELSREVQLAFFVDEDNKFAVRTIEPRGIFGTSGINSYSEGVEILDGFEFNRNTNEALSGYVVYFDKVGETSNSPFGNGYSQKYQLDFNNAISGINNYGTLNSNWIKLLDDAKLIAWRVRASQERGIDSITIPTTLYGISQNVADLILVNHRSGSLGSRLFEIESYDKDFSNSKVSLTAVDMQRVYGKGNCKWGTSSDEVNSNLQSGFSVFRQSSIHIGIIDAVTVWDTTIHLYQSYATVFATAYGVNIGSYLSINQGTYGSYSELIQVKSYFVNFTSVTNGTRTATITLGVNRGFNNSIIQRWGQSTSINRVPDQTTYYATTFKINTSLGTSFNFF